MKKQKYIPLCASGKLSVRKCARLIGCAPCTVSRNKKKYNAVGARCFIHGNTGRKPRNKRYDGDFILRWYDKHFSWSPYAVFCDMLNASTGCKPSYPTVWRTLSSAGRISPAAHKPVREKCKHKPRTERAHFGELVQIDGCNHDWLMDGHKITLHGAIDDATHKIVALYFCENECLLGYYQLLWQIKERYGLPRNIYSDRSSCFFVTKKGAEKMTIQEQLAGMKETRTQWQKVCADLGINLIAALSPQAKGRIERLWQTLQLRLPYIFRFNGIDTIEKANAFLAGYIDGFNKKYSVKSQKKYRFWKKPPQRDYDFLLAVREEKRTKSDGSFVYHGYKFTLIAARAVCVRFTLCLSERYGLRGYMGGKYYDVVLSDTLMDVYGDTMPRVEKELIYRYFYADTHSGRATIPAG